MSEKKGHSLSITVAWFFCYGMCYADKGRQAEHDLARIMRFPEGAIATEEDGVAIKRHLDGCSEHLPKEKFIAALALLRKRHPSLVDTGFQHAA